MLLYASRVAQCVYRVNRGMALPTHLLLYAAALDYSRLKVVLAVVKLGFDRASESEIRD